MLEHALIHHFGRPEEEDDKRNYTCDQPLIPCQSHVSTSPCSFCWMDGWMICSSFMLTGSKVKPPVTPPMQARQTETPFTGRNSRASQTGVTVCSESEHTQQGRGGEWGVGDRPPSTHCSKSISFGIRGVTI